MGAIGKSHKKQMRRMFWELEISLQQRSFCWSSQREAWKIWHKKQERQKKDFEEESFVKEKREKKNGIRKVEALGTVVVSGETSVAAI